MWGIGKAGNFAEEYYFVFIMCSWFLLDQELFWDVTILRELQAEEGARGVRKPQNRTEIRQKTANRIGFFPEYRNRAYV